MQLWYYTTKKKILAEIIEIKNTFLKAFKSHHDSHHK